MILKKFGEIFCGLTMVKRFRRCVSRYICCKTNTAPQNENNIKTVKHVEGRVRVRTLMTYGAMNSALKQSFGYFKLSLVMLQYNI